MQEREQQNSLISTFDKGMIKDLHNQPTGSWAHAINVKNNSISGEMGVISNEPANLKIGVIPYTIIGFIHMQADSWFIFSTDDINSEIGLFDDKTGTYSLIVNAPCLNFNKKHLITGAAKSMFDCTWQIYWDDGNNPTRTLNINNIPWLQTTSINGDCITYENTEFLDCEKLRIAPLIKTPIVNLQAGNDGGLLKNGAYQAYIAYVENDQRVTDYLSVSNIQTLFNHTNNKGSLQVNLKNLDLDYEFFELVILSNNQQNYTAKKIGIYSTFQTTIFIDFISPELESVDIKLLSIRTPAYEKSDKIFTVNNYLIRQGPREQFDFNYQPIANQIKTEWVVVEYPEDYYIKNGNNVGYLRDEVYSFFIRWVYNTGEKSKSYHIPGRVAGESTLHNGIKISEKATSGAQNTIDGINPLWKVYNTARISNLLQQRLEDGGVVLGRGDMAYWESTEKYPATQPEIWNSTYIDENGVNIGDTTDTTFDLCGVNIRHHKMPCEELSPILRLSNNTLSGPLFNPTVTSGKIRILGVEFSNIKKPKFNDGTEIPNIIGYEILRGSRKGNKSILAKGVFRNMREYTIPGTTGFTGLYPNYPYNDLRPDVYFHKGSSLLSKRTDGCHDFEQSIAAHPPLDKYSKKVFTFHSPDLMFNEPYLNAYEARIYGEYWGSGKGNFIKSELHPKNILIRNIAIIVGSIVGIGYAIRQMSGTRGDEVGFPASAFPGWSRLVGTDALDSLITGGALTDAAKGVMAASLVPGIKYTNQKDSAASNVPGVIRIFMGWLISVQKIAEGAQEIIDAIYNLSKPRDHAYKFNSVSDLLLYQPMNLFDNFRVKIKNQNFINSAFQVFDEKYKVNNLFRPKTVAVSLEKELPNPTVYDNSRFVLGGSVGVSGQPNLVFKTNNYLDDPESDKYFLASMQYGALKFNFDNQYGQLDKIKQVLISGFNHSILISLAKPKKNKNLNKTYTSPVLFGGDVYVNKYTEKVIMPIFYEFLYGQPDEYNFDYIKYINIPYPRYWMDTQKYDTSNIANVVFSLGLDEASLETALPNDLFYMDRHPFTCHKGNLRNLRNNRYLDPNPLFVMKYAYMYTHVNGILNFFTESEINLAHRDWEDKKEALHYNIADVKDLFDAQIIKNDNFYKYDISLSAGNFLTNLVSSGVLQDRTYNPKVSEFCFTYYPKRLIYSLQSDREKKKDFWKVFLVNNYKDFKDKVTAIKTFDKTGAIIFFPYLSPQLFQGVDELKTKSDIKLTLGDGGLFEQPLRNITNSDLANEYGSCESSNSIINTPSGIFFISQAQGKIFNFTDSLSNITDLGLKWWFNKYLPSFLIKQFPEFEKSKLSDNPVIGIGTQSIYDINEDIVYFCKKDYSVKQEYQNSVTYDHIKEEFKYNNYLIKLGDPVYFDDVSFTVSYDVKTKKWISFHDWHPDLVFPSINHFITTKTEIFPTPYCPPGYIYDYANNECQKYIYDTEPAIVDVEEYIPDTCECDPGYTLVYKANNLGNPQPENKDVIPGGGYYLATGNCLTVNGKPTNALCRKVSCKCPSSDGFEVWSLSGNCDNVYLAGGNGLPNYVNTDPVICEYRKVLKAPMALEGTGLWRHNDRCDLYTNYYGKDYPWEIEVNHNSGQSIVTLKSVEYQLESFVNKDCGEARWHDLDYNFDEVIIYNSEQISGLLKLEINPKENPFAILNYPIVSPNDIKILYSKEENKFRFNQFWDVTKDRGEFSNTQNESFISKLNGYIRELNFNNLNYQKSQIERKKFRHYNNKIIFRKIKSGNRQMLFRVNNVKLNLSQR